MDQTAQPSILVGFGSSRAAVAALRWAVGEARLRQARLRVVRTWERFPLRAFYALTSDCQAPRQTGVRAADRLAADVSAALGELASADVTSELAEGVAERILVDASAGASLLVLGSADPAPAVGSSVGPVIRACLRHAQCPVVIVSPAMAGAWPLDTAVRHGSAVPVPG